MEEEILEHERKSTISLVSMMKVRFSIDFA